MTILLYYSGGGSPWLPEAFLPSPAVMPSFEYNVRHGKRFPNTPDARLTRLFDARTTAKKKAKVKT